MTKIYTVIVLCLLSFAAAAQQSISGKIVDEHAQEIPFASVTLLKHVDSSKMKGVMTDTAGNFRIHDLKPGRYVVKISYIGYADFYSGMIDLTATKQHHLKEIRLSADSKQLNTVTVSGQRPLIEQSIDKTVMNIEKSVLAEGNTAMELLSKAPGVTVDGGNISLKGRSGTTIMINGKPTYLSGDQLANLLKGTSSSSISRIEIMASPGSQYDAAGSGGIVNIVLKKNSLNGFNGAVTGTAGAGRGFRHAEGMSLNYRTDRFNIYGNFNATNHNLESHSTAERQFFDGAVENGGVLRQSMIQQSTEYAHMRSNTFRAGVDVNLDAKNSLAFLINGAIGKYPTTHPNTSQLSNASGAVIWNAQTETTDREKWTDLLYNIGYVHRFNEDGHELKVDVDYFYHSSSMKQQLDTRYTDGNGNAIGAPASRLGDIPSNDDVYAAKVDYTLPLSKVSKLAIGWKGSDVPTENNLRYDTLQNGNYIYDASTSNHFVYKEQIQAAYLNFNTTLGTYAIQAGLRSEYTATEGHQVTTDERFKRDYIGFFPSLIVTKDLNADHQLKTGYSRRIKRPGYWDLNPFRVYDDPFSFYEGNPYLKPAMVNAFELGYNLKSRYFATLSYNHTGDVITSQIGQLGDSNISFQRPENLGSFTNIGLSMTASTRIVKWWTGSQFVNVYRNRYEINGSGEPLINAGNTISLNSQNTLDLSKGWKAEVSAFYRSTEVLGTSITRPYSIISTGLQKEILAGKGSLKLMVNDIFRGYRIREVMTYENIRVESRRNADSRYAQLSFSYKFGGKVAPATERQTSSDDIKGRM